MCISKSKSLRTMVEIAVPRLEEARVLDSDAASNLGKRNMEVMFGFIICAQLKP